MTLSVANSTGIIGVNEKTDMAVFTVQSLKDLTNIIIPHIMKYPLLTQKRADFLLFKLAN